MRIILIALVFWSQAVLAGLPNALHPMVIEPPFSFSERVFDLEPAFARARQSHKPVLVYLGAKDCPPCVNYGRFLDAHAVELAPLFDQFVLVELQTWLRGPELIFLMNQQRYTLPQFRKAIGDLSPKLRYPTVWMLSENGLVLKQIPTSALKELETVEGNIRLLSPP